MPRTLPSLFTLGALSALMFLAACSKGGDAPKPAAAPPEVGVVTVSTQDAPLELELPGRLAASEVAEIRPQVSGIVQKRLFEEGSTVRAGQPLYQLDAAAFEAERAGAAATLQRAEAQLAVARTKAARDAELLQADVISRQAAEDSAAALRQAEAEVAVARAALNAAQVQLARTRITAPIAGRVEISQVTAGALVTASQTQPLTTVQRLDPMQVDIVQGSAEMLALRRQLDAGSGSRELRLVLEDGSEHPEPARLQVSGMTVDPGTGAVTLRASVPNPRASLLPGMVVTARLLAGVNRSAIVVPQQAVSRTPTGDATAWVVGEGNKLERRRLGLGRSLGNQWLVNEGLKPGERLVVEGLQRARPDLVVTPVPAKLAQGG
ncbi:MAG: efflux RND transporter periplasmic adaptor subunit [Hydrogenophaga sp.]|uniref:efflux RND transporter periplasmic adaptor subunit n=1 Tax=Hydrogenophaga sp. TaxID=1904254 RepID=UPI00257F9BA6|nr:efflux RND transporter periplasmic adaptor subunit [Hydrogenophaga sp.]MBL0944716.1 efflux RND transporter periplasmic adaptor subunit [Hydrogenophaga sp.]